MTAVIQAGDLVKIPEAHYLYGIGDLVLRVAEVGKVQRLPDGEWLAVRGVQVAWNGQELGERRVLVRLSSLSARITASRPC